MLNLSRILCQAGDRAVPTKCTGCCISHHHFLWLCVTTLYSLMFLKVYFIYLCVCAWCVCVCAHGVCVCVCDVGPIGQKRASDPPHAVITGGCELPRNGQEELISSVPNN